MTLSRELYDKLKEEEMKERSETIRKAKEQGWGGSWGRLAATAGGITVSFVKLQSGSY